MGVGRRSAITWGGLGMLATCVGLSFANYASATNTVPPQPAPRLAYAQSAIADEGEQQLRVDYKRLDQRLQRLMASPEMVGLSIAVVEKGEIRFLKGYGVTQAGTSDPVTVGTVFRWASLSKGVAGTLLATLAGEGKLSLDDPVGRYAPSLKLPGNAQQRATIADMLSHRLGLPHNAYDDRLEQGGDPREIRGMLGQLSAVCAPGTCHGYQNIAFDAASEIVQTVTGDSYADAVRQKLFVPLGMTSASVTREGLVNARSWAKPHAGKRVLQVAEPYYRVPAAGGVNSSILDLGLWMRAQMGLADGIVKPKVLSVVHTPLIETFRRGRYDRAMSQARYALGWRDYTYQGHALVGHRGAVNGYRSLILFDPEGKNGVAMLWNSNTGRPVGMQLEILDMLFDQPTQDWLDLDKRSITAAIASRRHSG